MLTIEHPLTGEKLQIANRDFANEMTWDQAIEACENLGSGWRLPTAEELSTMCTDYYENFDATIYWSITEYDNDCAYAYFMESGSTIEVSKENKNYVRAVRSI